MHITLPIDITLHREVSGVKLYIYDNAQALSDIIPSLSTALIQKKIDNKQYLFSYYNGKEECICLYVNAEKEIGLTLEKIRKAASQVPRLHLTHGDIAQMGIINTSDDERYLRATIEGIVLSSYTFHKYKSKPDRQVIKSITVSNKQLSKKALLETIATLEGIYIARDLINEPPNVLTATALSTSLKAMASKSGIKCGIYTKAKIEQLGMGGILAVNKGSIEEPTLTILEYKHPQAKNLNQPIIFVGKGVVYDTGGLSLKPTLNSMDKMKSDMSGAAIVAGIMHAIATTDVPVHLISLIPATDNRPGMNAYTPGDVITMYSGQTVEVLNTDAEGRMILADALHLAKKYKPKVVIDIATLTGAASAAIGSVAMVAMGNDDATLAAIETAGQYTYERIVKLPLWDEYDAMIQSDIADMKNVGGPQAGAITAGKFLQRFVDYPWVHIDIAGVAFIDNRRDYHTVGGTGFGIRNIVHWIITNYNK